MSRYCCFMRKEKSKDKVARKHGSRADTPEMMATTRGQESVIGLMGPPQPQETSTLPVPQFWTSGYQNYENFLLF